MIAARQEARLRGYVNELSHPDVDDQQIAKVSRALAASGSCLTDRGPRSADFASTGGPTSLSTLLAPLFLRADGLCVPTLAVAGRPAGGVDVLATLSGYRTDLDVRDVERLLRQTGHAHFVAGPTWAPDDAHLFALRQRIGAQALPALVIASLVAKKLAVGVRGVGLDVRVSPHGNFGATATEAEVNARRFCRVARLVGLEAVCVLTDGVWPFQPFVGRGEAVMAMSELFDGEPGTLLQAHAQLCRRMAREVPGASRRGEAVPVADARTALIQNLEAQGSGYEALLARAAAVGSRPRIEFVASRDGAAMYRLGGLRDALVAHGRLTGLPDGAGVILYKQQGSPVVRGDVLLALRCEGSTGACRSLELAVARAVTVHDDVPSGPFAPLVIAHGASPRLLPP